MMEKEGDFLEVEKNLEEIVGELVEKMGFSCQIKVEKADSKEEDSFVCDIDSPESSFLIGQYGANLDSLQHIARVVARKKMDRKINFILDVNSYRREKTNSIINLAKNMAEQASQERRAVVMRPMSPYERRLAHMALSDNEKIKTESIGEGEDRRIVIKPVDLI